MQGRIIKIISNLYTVNAQGKNYECRARGIFRKDNITPMVGDNVEIDINEKVITEIHPRRNSLKRPVVSNVDSAVIVTSVKEPNLDLILLDKLISLISFNDITPIICFTKLDLLDNEEMESINKLKEYYEMIGIKVVYNTEVNKIKEIIKNDVVVLAGQTGAGKSSLINKLDSTKSLKTDEISAALGRGKHTTRHVELYEIAGGYLVDTPGFSSLDVDEIPKLDLRHTFVEFENYQCRFSDCVHDKEIDCGIKDAVNQKLILKSRYMNYIQFLKEAKK